jgi:hypothetical protein
MSTAAIQQAKPAANITAALATAQIFADLSTPTLAAILNVPGSMRLEAQPFTVSASGSATSVGAATTVTPSLYAALVNPAAPLVPANWILLGAGAAQVLNLTSGAWSIEANLMFESLGGKLGGTFKTQQGNVPVANAALANILAGLNGQNEPVFVLAAGLTFSVAGLNIGRLFDFSLNA